MTSSLAHVCVTSTHVLMYSDICLHQLLCCNDVDYAVEIMHQTNFLALLYDFSPNHAQMKFVWQSMAMVTSWQGDVFRVVGPLFGGLSVLFGNLDKLLNKVQEAVELSVLWDDILLL